MTLKLDGAEPRLKDVIWHFRAAPLTLSRKHDFVDTVTVPGGIFLTDMNAFSN